MNTTVIILLRLAHVVGGILWGGGAIAYLFFVKPSAESLGPAAPEFMRGLVERRKYPVFMQITSGLTIAAGAILYWRTSGSLSPFWLRSAPGIGFSLGAVAALIAFVVGTIVLGPGAKALGRVGAEIAASGKPPTPNQLKVLQGLQRRVAGAERINLIMLGVAMVTMATARYWSF